jgi:restriction system protein
MNIWLVRAGKQGQDEETELELGIAMIGFLEMPDLSTAENKEALQGLCQQAYPDASRAKLANFLGQCFSFSQRMQIGDLVVLPRKAGPRHIAIGRVTGPYTYREVHEQMRHVRSVEWVRTDVLRAGLGQDLLNSLGALSTICQIKKNNAEERFKVIAEGGSDPGALGRTMGGPVELPDVEPEEIADVEQLARDQVLAHINQHFKGHDLSRLVEAILQADGYVTELSPPGPDGGVDILAGKGSLGFDNPRLCVQVKSSQSPADVTIFRALQGSMQSFKSDQGLLVCWGGFNSVVRKEARMSFFSVRLWDADDLLVALFRTYDKLPEELQTELPLKRVWALVVDENE